MKEKAYYAGDEDKTYILSLAEAASGIGNIRYYVDILKEKAMLRRVITACGICHFQREKHHGFFRRIIFRFGNVVGNVKGKCRFSRIDSGKKNYEGRVQEVSEMTRSLKIMPRE